jgi:agmatinase
MDFYSNNRDRIEIFWAKDKKNWSLSQLDRFFKNKTVYITFDVDGFDSSIMPATGTPEPGGLLWEDVLPIIKKVCQTSSIVGADINELAPIKNFDSYNFLVAKLAYKILAYTFEFKNC